MIPSQNNGSRSPVIPSPACWKPPKFSGKEQLEILSPEAGTLQALKQSPIKMRPLKHSKETASTDCGSSSPVPQFPPGFELKRNFFARQDFPPLTDFVCVVKERAVFLWKDTGASAVGERGTESRS